MEIGGIDRKAQGAFSDNNNREVKVKRIKLTENENLEIEDSFDVLNKAWRLRDKVVAQIPRVELKQDTEKTLNNLKTMNDHFFEELRDPEEFTKSYDELVEFYQSLKNIKDTTDGKVKKNIEFVEKSLESLNGDASKIKELRTRLDELSLKGKELRKKFFGGNDT